MDVHRTELGLGANMLTVKAVAERLQACEKHVRTLICNGDLLAVRLGPRAVRIAEGELARFIAQGGVKSPSIKTRAVGGMWPSDTKAREFIERARRVRPRPRLRNSTPKLSVVYGGKHSEKSRAA